MPFRCFAQLRAIETERGVRQLRPAQQRIGNDGAGERALDRLLNPTRRYRIDRQRGVTQLNSVRRDTIVAEIGCRIDGPYRRDQCGVTAIVHQAGKLDQPLESFRQIGAWRGSKPARIDKGERVMGAIGQRNAPIPGVLTRFDPRHGRQDSSAPITVDRQRGWAGFCLKF
jgi:hypothetical protein